MLSSPKSLMGNSLLSRRADEYEFRIFQFGLQFGVRDTGIRSLVGPGEGRICHNEAGFPVPPPWTRYQAKGSP